MSIVILDLMDHSYAEKILPYACPTCHEFGLKGALAKTVLCRNCGTYAQVDEKGGLHKTEFYAGVLHELFPISMIFRLSDSGEFLSLKQVSQSLCWSPLRAKVFTKNDCGIENELAEKCGGFIVRPCQDSDVPLIVDWVGWLQGFNMGAVNKALPENVMYYIKP